MGKFSTKGQLPGGVGGGGGGGEERERPFGGHVGVQQNQYTSVQSTTSDSTW